MTRMEVLGLGRTEMQVARIGFGGMTIPKVSVEQAVATINRALVRLTAANRESNTG